MSTGSFPSGAGEERIRGKLGQTFGRRLRKTFFLDAAYLPRLGYYITVTENFHHCPCCKEKKLVGARPGEGMRTECTLLQPLPPPPAFVQCVVVVLGCTVEKINLHAKFRLEGSLLSKTEVIVRTNENKFLRLGTLGLSTDGKMKISSRLL